MSEIASAVQIPAPGRPWPEQGGVYVGARVIDGVVHHRIIPGGTEYDVPASHNNAAERIADKGEINGFSDWEFGDQRDLMLAYVNAPDLFHQTGRESIQITSTPYGSRNAWAVRFEYGLVDLSLRSNEFLEQNRNRTCIVMLTFNGETKSVTEWASQLCMRQANITERLRLGWSVERALTQPIKARSKK